MDSIQENKTKWDNRAKTYDKSIRTRFFTSIQSKVIEKIDLSPTMTFLDIGCGTGWAVKYAYDKAYAQGEFYGIDISEKMIGFAKEKYQDKQAIKFFQCSAESINLSSNTIDRIICTNSFHHYSNPITALVDAKRILKSKGVIGIADITADSFFSKLLNGLLKMTEKAHMNFYSSRQYEQMFETVELKYSSTKINSMIKIHIGEKK